MDVRLLSRILLATFMLATVFFGSANPSHALEPIRVGEDDIAIDITEALEKRRSTDGVLKISTAPDADGIVRRVEVRSRDVGKISNWAIFALANTSDRQIDRLIVAPHYRLVGSGLIWPDLDSKRITAITPSEGFSLDRQDEPGADIFLITLDPGAVITLVAEQTTEKLPRLFLWEPATYKETANSYTLYYGIVLGISGLLAVFLTILFVIRGSSMFPATAAIAWGVLAYISVDFGFWNKIAGVATANDPFWRAGTEVFLGASILVFLHAYLSLNRWNRNFSLITIGWILALIILMGVAIVEPSVAAGLARFSFAMSFILSAGLLIYLGIKKSDRAIMLVPTWILLGFWLAGAALAATGRLENDIIQPALGGGLVLFVLLLGFTVMQHAFSGGAFAQGLMSDTERSALALAGAGDVLWDWDTQRQRIAISDELTSLLHDGRKLLNASPADWQNVLHPNDRDRFSASLKAVVEHKRGRLSQTFRLRGTDGHFHWFRLRARPLLDVDGEVTRCVGTLTDVTYQKKSEERLLQDSVRDSLTGLENGELFAGKLKTLVELAHSSETIRPTVFHIDIDGFSEVNRKLGFTAGDTILLTVSRRLSRLLKPGDSLARLSGDEFAILLVSETGAKKIASYADTIRRALRAPVEFADQEIVLSASIGLASWSLDHTSADEMMRDAELAKGEAKRLGGNTTEPFSPRLRSTRHRKATLMEDLKSAIQREQISLLYQPIVDLQTSGIVGFEALMRWQHPKLGELMPSDFVPLAEQSGFIQQLGSYLLSSSLKDFKGIRERTGSDCYVGINVSSRELLQSDIVHDITGALEANGLPPQALRMEITESLVMENPEHAAQVLNRIKALGIGLSLDDFGTGYSSLSYLLKFPFDTLKIDKSFVQSRLQKEKIVVLRSIITLAHGLDQSVIAEGVEYDTEAADLLQLGCQYGQGYYFGKPVTAQEAQRLLEGA